MKNIGNMHICLSKSFGKNFKKLLSLLLLLAVQMMPLYSFGQQGFTHQSFGNSVDGGFTHQSFGNSFDGGFTHQSFGNSFDGGFTHQSFGNSFDGSFTHQSFGNGMEGDFTHQGFGNDVDGGFSHQPFGYDAPMGSGWLILLSAGVGYAMLNRKQQKESNH